MTRFDRLARKAITYRSTPLVILWYISAVSFFIGLGFIDSFAPVTQALLGVEMKELFSLVPVVWGIVGLFSVALEMLGVVLDSKVMTRTATITYVALWAFAGVIYFIGGYYVLLLAIAIPHLLFWAWNQAVRYDHDRIVREVRGLFKILT